MKRIATLALFALGGTLGAGKALGQDHEVRANIPFDFMVGNSMLPAGSYEITTGFGVIAIRNSGVGQTVESFDSPDNTQSASRAVLVFQQHDNHYFLCKILGGPSGGLNVALPESKSEERARTLELMASNESQISIPASEGN